MWKQERTLGVVKASLQTGQRWEPLGLSPFSGGLRDRSDSNEVSGVTPVRDSSEGAGEAIFSSHHSLKAKNENYKSHFVNNSF